MVLISVGTNNRDKCVSHSGIVLLYAVNGLLKLMLAI